MKIRCLRWWLLISIFLVSQQAIAGGVDVFKTTQTAQQDGLTISCASSFEAPFDDLYVYESVWNWAIFGGYWSLVPVKVGEKYTGEFRYAGMDCVANRIVIDDLTQKTSLIEVNFYFDVNGKLTVESSDVPLNVSIEEYENNYDAALLLFKVSKLAYEIKQSGFVATALSEISLGSLQQATIFTIIAHLASNSFFIYIEQNEIKEKISNFMSNEAAVTTKNSTEEILTSLVQIESVYRYIRIMPAINNILISE